MFKLLTILACSLILQATSLCAQMFELATTHDDDGKYTYSFSEGFSPVAFGLSQGSGFINFSVADATQVTAPEDWLVSYYDGGFEVAYNGVFQTYPLGFKTIEITFYSDLNLEEIGTNTGIVAGPVVLKNGYSPEPFEENGSFITGPVGYQVFYFDMPAYEGPQLTAANLIAIFGFTLEDIRPVTAKIKLKDGQVKIRLKNIIEDANCMLQFNESLGDDGWINVFTFTHEDLDENGAVSHDKDILSGFFRVTLL